MTDSHPLSDRQRQQIAVDGYTIVPGLVPDHVIAAIRSEVLRVREAMAARGETFGHALEQGAEERRDLPAAARYRKLPGIATESALIWERLVQAPSVRAIVAAWLGADAVLKFSSAFLKPAGVGGATPWHQDIGLWRDHDHTALNGWCAIDAATIENGCLQVIPGSHRGPVVEHVTYDDGLHAELPRELLAEREPRHVELAPGSALLWHSHLWHSSPPNRSDRDRIGIGCVWQHPHAATAKPFRGQVWALRAGAAVAFPPPAFAEDVAARQEEPGYA